MGIKPINFERPPSKVIIDGIETAGLDELERTEIMHFCEYLGSVNWVTVGVFKGVVLKDGKGNRPFWGRHNGPHFYYSTEYSLKTGKVLNLRLELASSGDYLFTISNTSTES